MKNDKREIQNIDLLFTNDVTSLLRQKDRMYRFPFARNVSETFILYLLSMGAICQIICIYIYIVCIPCEICSHIRLAQQLYTAQKY